MQFDAAGGRFVEAARAPSVEPRERPHRSSSAPGRRSGVALAGRSAPAERRFYPQATLAEVIRGRLASPLPLSRLLDGKRIEPKFYGDAWTVMGTLLQDPNWTGTLPRVFAAAARTGSTSLVDLGVDLTALDRDRRAQCSPRPSR